MRAHVPIHRPCSPRPARARAGSPSGCGSTHEASRSLDHHRPRPRARRTTSRCRAAFAPGLRRRWTWRARGAASVTGLPRMRPTRSRPASRRSGTPTHHGAAGITARGHRPGRSTTPAGTTVPGYGPTAVRMILEVAHLGHDETPSRHRDVIQHHSRPSTSPASGGRTPPSWSQRRLRRHAAQHVPLARQPADAPRLLAQRASRLGDRRGAQGATAVPLSGTLTFAVKAGPRCAAASRATSSQHLERDRRHHLQRHDGSPTWSSTARTTTSGTWSTGR